MCLRRTRELGTTAQAQAFLRKRSIEKDLRGGEWLVYACDDSRSLVVVAQDGNPAAPFYFMFYVTPEGAMRLNGEGNGDRHASDLAFAELKVLSTSDVSVLVSQAQAANQSH